MDVLNSHTATFASVVAFTTGADGIIGFGGIFLVGFGWYENNFNFRLDGKKTNR